VKLQARNKLLTQAKFLARRFEPLDMTRVLDIVYLLEVEQDAVYFKNQEYLVVDLCCELFSKHHAATVPVWFLGGPPDNREWFNDTLYTYVLDCIMSAIAATRVGVVIRQLKITVKKDASAE